MKSIKTEIGDFTGTYFENLFDCHDYELESLEGAPVYVDGYFDCTDNNLKSLKGAPQYVDGDFYCYGNPNLESLEGAPKSIGGDFFCEEEIKKGENLYIIINVLLNGCRDKMPRAFNKKQMLKVLKKNLK